MTIGTKPAADFIVDASLVRALLQEQHPDLAHLVPVKVSEGWDNAVFRLGDELAVRVPRRAASAQGLRPRPQVPQAAALAAAVHRRGAQVRHLIVEYVRHNPSELTPFAHQPEAVPGRAAIQRA